MKNSLKTLVLGITAALVAALALSVPASAEVKRVDVTSRVDIGSSGYEKIVGKAHFAVDPKDPRNRVIADIDKAPVNAAGLVEFSGDIAILRPKDGTPSSGIALVDVVNRGRKTILTQFNRGAVAEPVSDADLGDRFLMQQGLTLVFVGWEFDVRRQGTSMTLDVPAAGGVTGPANLVRGEFVPGSATAEETVTDLTGYSPADPNGADATLTVRDGPFGTAETLPRNTWTLKGNTITMPGKFQPGRTYELSYRPEKFPVSGLGMAAFRDVAAWVRRSPSALARAEHAIAFGSSQSGRFLRTFMYYGFNTDERGNQVFDGIWAHIAGGARLSLNERGATPTALSMWTATAFPFANAAMRDPLTGRTEGLLDNDRARQNQPRTIFTNTAVEYWGGGRSAGFVHATPDGTADIPLADNTRVYFLTGTQHGPARFPTKANAGQQPDNPAEYVWTMRALLVAMQNWVKQGTPPPPSQYPRISDRTLVPATAVNFPAIPGVHSPRAIPAAREAGKQRALLVPQVDADGNELSGVRTAEILVPMATYTGWNFRALATGGPDQLVNLLGSAIPFAHTMQEREAKRDPRRSVAERYSSRDKYLSLVREANERLVKGGYLRADDAAEVMKRIDEQWRSAASTN
jgi:alpha/beta hydrolase family protein